MARRYDDDCAMARRSDSTMTQWCDSEDAMLIAGHRLVFIALASSFHRNIALLTVLRMHNWKEKWHEAVNVWTNYITNHLYSVDRLDTLRIIRYYKLTIILSDIYIFKRAELKCKGVCTCTYELSHLRLASFRFIFFLLLYHILFK